MLVWCLEGWNGEVWVGYTIGATVVCAVLGHGAVAGKIDGGMGELEGRCQGGESNGYSHFGWIVGAGSVSNGV